MMIRAHQSRMPAWKRLKLASSDSLCTSICRMISSHSLYRMERGNSSGSAADGGLRRDAQHLPGFARGGWPGVVAAACLCRDAHEFGIAGRQPVAVYAHVVFEAGAHRVALALQ